MNHAGVIELHGSQQETLSGGTGLQDGARTLWIGKVVFSVLAWNGKDSVACTFQRPLV